MNNLTKNQFLILLIVGLVFLTRFTNLHKIFFNIDESVSAVIAGEILEGGIPYRDAVDHRGPVTYYLYALAFMLFCKYSMFGVHLLFSLIIAMVAFMLYRLGCLCQGSRAGLMAALLFVCFSWIGPPYDLWAAHTEWPMILFSTVGMYLAFKALMARRFLGLIAAGMCFGVSFLSKQIGLFDLAAICIFILVLALSGKLLWREFFKSGALLIVAFVLPLAAAALYFRAHGALDDLIFYVWTYNTQYYIPELTGAQRIAAAPGAIYHFFYNKILLLVLWLGGLWMCVRSWQTDASRRQLTRHDLMLGLALWCAFVFLGALWSGRAGETFQHYFIQVLPAVSLLAGIFLEQTFVALTGLAKSGARALGFARQAVMFLVLMGIAFPLFRHFQETYPAYYGEDPRGLVLSAYIDAVTKKEDAIFVWGGSSEIYVLANRRPASRYTVCNVLTGMIYWTNSDAHIDTTYAIVPGTREIVMQELAANEPRIIVDTAPADLWGYGKYPLSSFPQLAAFVESFYELDPGYGPNAMAQAIKVYRRKSIDHGL